MKEHLEDYTKRTRVIYVDDGDNVSIIAKLHPSVADPTGVYKAVAQVYRIVVSGPQDHVLELVPLGSKPALLTETREPE